MKVRSCLAALCFLIFNWSAADGQTPKQNDQSSEWEYKQFFSPSDELLNHYGKDGWEIASSAGGGGDTSSFYWVILKRSNSHPLFGKQTPEFLIFVPTPPPKSKCKLTLAQAPVIRGLRLGMTSDELFAIFPGNEREESDRAEQLKRAELPPNYGHTYFQLNPSNYPTKDKFTGVGNLSVGLFDRKVGYIRATYSNTPQLDRPGQLVEIITRQFGLPEFKAWPGYHESLEHWHSPSLYCDGFTFQVVVGRGSISISLTDPGNKRITDERKKADLAKKLEGYKW